MGISDHQERWSPPPSVIVEFEDRRSWYLDDETSLFPIIGDWGCFSLELAETFNRCRSSASSWAKTGILDASDCIG